MYYSMQEYKLVEITESPRLADMVNNGGKKAIIIKEKTARVNGEMCSGIKQ